MSGLTITTNHVPREVLDAAYLTEAERADFDYLPWSAIEAGDERAEFVRYRGELLDLGEFSATPRASDAAPLELRESLQGWDGYRSDSFFSGLVIRYPVDNREPDFERVIVGRYCS